MLYWPMLEFRFDALAIKSSFPSYVVSLSSFASFELRMLQGTINEIKPCQLV